jgi:hypothetical protein
MSFRGGNPTPPDVPNWFVCSMGYRSVMNILWPDSESP